MWLRAVAGSGATGSFPLASVSLLWSRICEVRRLKKVRTPVSLETCKQYPLKHPRGSLGAGPNLTMRECGWSQDLQDPVRISTSWGDIGSP